MSSTNKNRTDDLARSLFDEVVVPFAEARRSNGCQAYFKSSGEADASSYFDPPLLAKMQPTDFEFPGGGTPEGLIDALVQYWIKQGDDGLAAMGPRLKEIAEAVQDEVEANDGSVDSLCYTMF